MGKPLKTAFLGATSLSPNIKKPPPIAEVFVRLQTTLFFLRLILLHAFIARTFAEEQCI